VAFFVRVRFVVSLPAPPADLRTLRREIVL